MIRIICFLVLTSFLVGCASHLPVKATPPFSSQPTTGEGWQARFEPDGTVTIFAANQPALEVAVNELCNQEKMICTGPVPIGRVFVIQRYSAHPSR